MAEKVSKTPASKLDLNVGTLIQMIEDDEIDFDAAIQRGLIWDKMRNSKFIQTILLEWPTGVFYFNKTKDGSECMDGKQRSHALYNFVKNGEKLHKNTPPIIDRKGVLVEIAGKKYDELPEELQNAIMRYGLLVYSFDNMSIESKVEFFTRINLGKPVTAADIARIKVKSRKVFQKLAKHTAMEIGVTEMAKAKFADEDVIKNIWVMCYNENKSLLNKDTSPLFETIEISDEHEKELVNVLKYMEKFLIQANLEKAIFIKIRAKVHLSSLGYMAYLAIKNDITAEDYCERAFKFFTTGTKKPSVNEEYNDSCVAGGAKPEKVNIRLKALDEVMA